MLPFENWRCLAELSVSDLPRHGAVACVYAIRSRYTLDVLYIGSTNKLARRIFGNYVGGVGGGTTQRINELLFSEGKISEVELAWLETDAHEEMEKELLREFETSCGRLPSWNRRR
jgi:hypothetical protein